MPDLMGAKAWLDRAEEHLANLKTLCSTTAKTEVDAMVASIRFEFPDEGNGWAYTKPTAQIPQLGSLLAGETIQALRRSLDYLIYEVAWLDSGVEQQDTQFPIDYSQNTFERRRTRQRPEDHGCYLIGVSDEHAAAIKLLQPFKGMNSPKWPKVLGNLSNPDKHRHLMVANSQSSSQITGWALASVGAANHEVTRVSPDSFTFSWHIDSSAPDRMHMKFHVTAYVALEDGRRVVEVLDEIKTEVTRVIADFAPCFEGHCLH
jgi:hypothetical protein